MLSSTLIEEWNEDVYELILYSLARDNECEHVLEMLIEYPNRLKAIAYKALSYHDHEARWQIAHALGEIQDADNEDLLLLSHFSQDEHEYVRRRALYAIEKTKGNLTDNRGEE